MRFRFCDALLRQIVLIDTWWNVNLFVLRLPAFALQVLIDTWWNVNLFVLRLPAFALQVLIDTWWNVNKKCSCSLFSTR